MKKYRIYVSDGFNLDGTRRRFSKTIETDLKGRDLEKFLTIKKYEFEDEVKKKDPKFQKLARGTFEAYSVWWLEYKVEHEGISPKTKQEYDKFLNTRILKYIGKKILDKLTNGDMLELMEEIRNSPAKTKSGKLSDKSVKHYHTLLKTMFNDAVKLKILEESPMENVPIKTPKNKLKDNYYDIEDVNSLLKVLPQAPVRYQLATLLTISTGVRIGELSALKWKHIDLENMKITIEQANSYTTDEGSFIKDTKNTYSERMVAFPKSLIPLFLQHKEDEKVKKELAGRSPFFTGTDEDFIFTQNNGKMIFIGTIPKWFRKFLKKHNLKHITFHGLRHTHTTISIYSGINVVSVSRSLGHSKTSTTTDFYAHHIESVEREMANVFDDIFQSGTQGGTQEPNLRIVK